jgi:ATP-dependent RNA helicase DDX56/DBP9
LGYVRPTLVQSKCLPLAITSGRDLLVRARTGSGKTLAYCLPILHKILSKEENDDGDGFVKAVILVPTRELCTQVTNTLTSLIYYCDEVVSVATLFSGKNSSETSLVQQEAMLRDRPDVLVSTPAGLLAHIKRDGSLLKTTLKESVDSLVVDEADLVLSFGK